MIRERVHSPLPFRLLLFAHGPPEVPESLAQGEVLAVRIDDRLGPFEAEAARRGIQVGIVRLDMHHLGEEHVVRTQRQDLPHAALDMHRGLSDDRRLHLLGRQGREAHLAELVAVAARTHTAPVDGPRQPPRREVDDKFARAADDPVRMALGADRDVAHRRCRADGARPGHGQHVVLFGRGATAHQHRRQRVEHRSGFPALFHDSFVGFEQR